MRKLLSANLSRLWGMKAFWVTVLFMILTECFLCLLLFRQSDVPLDFALFIALQGIGILTSVFFSLFLGTEYNDGTIRNKLIVGHKRGGIYLASFITGIVAVSVIYIAGVLTGGVIAILLKAETAIGIGQIVLAVFIGWLACVSYIAIFNLVGMLSSNKARTSIICILTAFFLVFFGLACYSFARPGLLSSPARDIIQFLFDFNPYGQSFQVMSVDIATLWKLAAYSVLLSFVLTGVGVYAFRKKDLK